MLSAKIKNVNHEVNYWAENMAWTKPKYSKNQVRKAGRDLINKDSGESDFYNKSLDIFNNWRSSHSYPLHRIRRLLENHARKIYPDAIVAQRLKREKSTRKKLIFQPTMKLNTMQDIGGCRAVVKSIDQVYKICGSLKKCQAKHHLYPIKDYIKNPKSSGYRGIHMVYGYRGKDSPYDGLKIEIQIRTELQHAWASAVEIAQAYTDQPLKSSIGAPEWLRFFSLMGSVFAMRENTNIIPKTPLEPEDLKIELRKLKNEQNYVKFISWMNLLPRFKEKVKPDDYHFILICDYNASGAKIQSFRKEDLIKAQEAYDSYERDFANTSDKNVVLVSVSDLEKLYAAYPAYSADYLMTQWLFFERIMDEFIDIADSRVIRINKNQ